MNLTIISAGAGSGKTYTLTHKIHELIASGQVRPECIMATTFTKKAAAELRERVKLKLIEKGMLEESYAVDQALIGTVHSIGTRILQRFAFEMGYSPQVEIMPEGEAQRMFNLSISRILTVEVTDQMQKLCEKLAFAAGYDETHFDWRKELKTLADVIRTNDLSAKAIEKSRKASWNRVAEMLYTPDADEAKLLPATSEGWNSRLAALLSTTIDTIETKGEDTTVGTANAIEHCRAVMAQLKNNSYLPWSEWAKLTKSKFTKKSQEDAAPLMEFCQKIEANPALRAELQSYIDSLFELAEKAIKEFQNYKRKRGVIDYTDMEVMLNEALDHPSVRMAFTAEIDLLMVDEFQDTSPLQLSIFLKISALAKKSVWVGDPKQSIYGFRGAEPALMKAVVDATGGIKPENILKQSFRSRRDLVYATNSIFAKAFTDLPTEQIVLETGRVEPEGLPPALIHWHLRLEENEQKKPNLAQMRAAIAHKIKEVLQSGLLVQSKETKELRPIVPGDIAVLCRSNDEGKSIAESLTKAGLFVSMSQAGLMSTTEGKLLMAALRLLVDKNDSLSVAELLILTREFDMPQLIAHRSEHLSQNAQNAAADKPRTRWARELPLIGQLEAMRKRIRDLSTSEVLELLLVETDLGQFLAPFGHLQHRLANLEQFRSFASAYELVCQRTHSASSLAGWLLWLDKVADQKLDQQNSSETSDAVTVLTYHKSKGLEYPFVVCCSLEKKQKERFWGLTVCSDAKTIDLKDVLKDRFLELRVHPYGTQIAKTPLQSKVQESEVFARETIAARAEETRLLYVGLTRARDYLVIPGSVNPSAWLNRTFNNDDDALTLSPDSTETPFYYPFDAPEPLHLDLQIFRFATDFAPSGTLARNAHWFQAAKGKAEHNERTIHVQTEPVPSDRLRQMRAQHVSLALPNLDAWGQADEAAFTQFFYGDDMARPQLLRTQAADRQLLIQGQSSVSATELVAVADAIYASLQVKNVEGPIYRELDIDGRTAQLQMPRILHTQLGALVCLLRESIGDGARSNAQALENQLLWSVYAMQQDTVATGLRGGIVLQIGQSVGFEWQV
jgi:ATP-dependent helicase/nuclease subunit A